MLCQLIWVFMTSTSWNFTFSHKISKPCHVFSYLYICIEFLDICSCFFNCGFEEQQQIFLMSFENEFQRYFWWSSCDGYSPAFEWISSLSSNSGNGGKMDRSQSKVGVIHVLCHSCLVLFLPIFISFPIYIYVFPSIIFLLFLKST